MSNYFIPPALWPTYKSDAFITNWKVDAGNSVGFRSTGDYVINWGDGCVEIIQDTAPVKVPYGESTDATFLTTDSTGRNIASTSNNYSYPTHVYERTGEYKVTINKIKWSRKLTGITSFALSPTLAAYSKPGTKLDKSTPMERRYKNERNNAEQLINVEQWGTAQWIIMCNMFYHAKHMIITATDAPDLSKVENIDSMFEYCKSLNSPLNHWNTENITSMRRTFNGAVKFNQSLDNWNVSKVECMTRMFAYAKQFNQSLEHWDTANVSSMKSMFAKADNFNQNISNWPFNKLVNLTDMLDNISIYANGEFNQNLDNINTGTNLTTNMFGNMSLDTYKEQYHAEELKSTLQNIF